MILAIDTFNQERFGLITGSRCACLFPKRSAEVGQRTLAKQLANELYFKFYDEFGNWQTEHGKLGEAFAFDHYVKYHDANIKKGRWIRKGDCGGTTDAEGSDYGLDWKCPTSLEKWTGYLYDGIDSDQENQCQMYMYLTGFKKWVIAAYLVETNWMADNGLVYPIAPKDRMILIEVKRNEGWEGLLLHTAPKIIEMRDQYVEILKTRFEPKA